MATVSDRVETQEIPDFRELPVGPRARRLILAAQRGSFWFARHWLALANGFNLVVILGAAVIPAMMAAGLHSLADPLFASYRLICHQQPERSFFLFGQQMAMCQRDLAIYGSMGMAGLVFGLNRRGWRPLPWRWYLLSLLPIGVDGLTQLFGFRESSWGLRLLTGTIFGSATVWLAYPYLERFAADILAEETRSRGDAEGAGLRTQNPENRGVTR